ncbi:MAG: peptide deformylase [Clostridia bacterium]
MAIRKIVENGDEILRKKAKLVENVDEKIKVLVEDMIETLHTYNGVGLAANQVGILKRIVVIDVYDGTGPIVLINPEIVKEKGEQTVDEGCLSFPNQFAKVVRPQKVTVKALDENGKERKITGEDLLAQAFSHELDHLDGVLFIDKMIPGTLEYVTPEDLQAAQGEEEAKKAKKKKKK